MKKLLLLLTLALAALSSCGDKTTADTTDEVADTMAKYLAPSSMFTMYSRAFPGEGGLDTTYTVYQIRDSLYGMCHIYGRKECNGKSRVVRIPTLYYRYEGRGPFYDEGAPCPYWFVEAPDHRHIYVVAHIMAMSNGWITDYQLFRIDCQTMQCQFVVDCAGIKVTDKGFTVAQARCLNEEEATCAIEEEWAIHDEQMNWDGKVVSKGTDEYTYAELEQTYGEYPYVRDFSAIAPSDESEADSCDACACGVDVLEMMSL